MSAGVHLCCFIVIKYGGCIIWLLQGFLLSLRQIVDIVKHLTHILLAIAAVALPSCGEEAPGDVPVSAPVQIIIDTDIGSSTDDLFALQAAFDCIDGGECELLGIVVDRVGEDYAAVADVMATHYGHGDIAIASARQGAADPTVWIDYCDMHRAADSHGEPIFRRSISDYTALPDGYKLYRRLLSGAPDASVNICSIGFVNCIADLLESEADEYSDLSGEALVRAKVKCLYIMAGAFSDVSSPDYNFAQCMDYSRRMMQQWPGDVDVIFCPTEVGDKLNYQPEQVKADYGDEVVNPIKYVYDHYTIDDGQRMWDYITLISAVEGVDDHRLSARGIVSLNADATTTFTAQPSGNCRYMLPLSGAEAEALLSRLRLR